VDVGLTKTQGFGQLINIGGLAIGMTAALIIGLWIVNETQFKHLAQKLWTI